MCLLLHCRVYLQKYNIQDIIFLLLMLILIMKILKVKEKECNNGLEHIEKKNHSNIQKNGENKIVNDIEYKGRIWLQNKRKTRENKKLKEKGYNKEIINIKQWNNYWQQLHLWFKLKGKWCLDKNIKQQQLKMNFRP